MGALAIQDPTYACINVAVDELRRDRDRSMTSELLRELMNYLAPLKERQLSRTLDQIHQNGLRLPATVDPDSGNISVASKDMTKILKALIEHRDEPNFTPSPRLTQLEYHDVGVPTPATKLTASQEERLLRAGMLARRHVNEATHNAIDEADHWRRCVALVQSVSSTPKGTFVVDLSADDFLYDS